MSDPEQPYEYFSVLNLKTNAGRRDLSRLLFSESRWGMSAQRIWDLMIAPVGAGIALTAVVEKQYVDRDYSASYGRFYSRVFRSVEKWCKRIHFFEVPLTEADLRDPSSLAKQYLGCVVIRPLGTSIVGRTILRPGTVDPNLEYHLNAISNDVHLAGSTLSVRAAPFMEQDTRVAACASADLWMASEVLAKKVGNRTYSTAEITKFATTYDLSVGRAMPSEGLTDAQMVNALHSMGYDPILYGGLPRLNVAQRAAYHYLESELPVIVSLNFVKEVSGKLAFQDVGHVLTLVGHKYEPTASPSAARLKLVGGKELVFYPSSGWVPEFVCHDDQRGPYRNLRFLTATEYTTKHLKGASVANDLADKTFFEISTDTSSPPPIPVDNHGIVLGLLVPLPQGVSLRAEEAERKAAYWVKYFPDLLAKKMREHLQNNLDYSKLVLRTYLTSSTAYKSRLRTSGINPSVRDLLLGKPLPRWMWITEVSTIDRMSQPNALNRTMVGEVIIDSSANPATESYVVIHLPGVISTSVPEEGDLGKTLRFVQEVDGDGEYSHLVR